MQGYKARAMQRGLAKHGEPSSLDGVPCGNVHLEYDVDMHAADMNVADDNHMAPAIVAAVEAAYNPRSGQMLVHPDGNFRLTRKVRDSGYIRKYIVVRQ